MPCPTAARAAHGAPGWKGSAGMRGTKCGAETNAHGRAGRGRCAPGVPAVRWAGLVAGLPPRWGAAVTAGMPFHSWRGGEARWGGGGGQHGRAYVHAAVGDVPRVFLAKEVDALAGIQDCGGAPSWRGAERQNGCGVLEGFSSRRCLPKLTRGRRGVQAQRAHGARRGQRSGAARASGQACKAARGRASGHVQQPPSACASCTASAAHT